MRCNTCPPETPWDTGTESPGITAFAESTPLSSDGFDCSPVICGGSLATTSSACDAPADLLTALAPDSGARCGSTTLTTSAASSDRSPFVFPPATNSTFEAGFTGVPAEGFSPDGKSDFPTEFGFE